VNDQSQTVQEFEPSPKPLKQALLVLFTAVYLVGVWEVLGLMGDCFEALGITVPGWVITVTFMPITWTVYGVGCQLWKLLCRLCKLFQPRPKRKADPTVRPTLSWLARRNIKHVGSSQYHGTN
jgi:hypothetical protein